MSPGKLHAILGPTLRRRLNAGRFGLESFIADTAASIAAGSLVVDVGAGEAPYANQFKHTTYVAIDWNRARQSNGCIHVTADSSMLPLREQCADVVISTQMLEHVRNPWAVARELSRVLRESGLLYISVPLFDPEHEMPHDYWRFTGEGLRLVLEEAGLQPLEIKRRGGYFWVLNKQLRSVHEYLFPPLKNPLLRLLRYPFKLGAVFLAEVAFPLIFYWADQLDSSRCYTVGYFAVAIKRKVPEP